ncbi:MAG: aminotransferase class V-fold PLP-dependent enzyme [Ruminiclostridium sp.]|nr:aminotransferase class V-fold PLP-dependent enzyme [Ruminiclostridium sp.]
MNTPIHDFLQDYAARLPVRCHMPGGKGQNDPFDITEIYGADSLYESVGIILESEKNAAALFGAGDTLYSCGGSTLCIQGMLGTVRALTEKRTIAAGRYSHRSLVSACALLGFEVRWIDPGEFLGAVVSPEAVDAAIDGDTAAVFLNAVDYYGGTADIAAIAEVCHRRGVLFLVDNAHGAYRVFTDDHPITRGADMTADSAHKTLPALTGAAYLHLKSPAHRPAAKKAMALFGSSSPSYLMMDSLDLCNRFLSEGAERARQAMEDTARLKEELKRLGFTLRNSDALRVSDPLRITVDAAAFGYTGDGLAALLRESGAECEMSDERYTVLLFSAVQPREDFSRLSEIFLGIPQKPSFTIPPHKLLKPECVLSLREALFSEKKTVKTETAEGRICAEIVSPCPPCVPLVMPGERIDGDCVEELLRYGVREIPCIKER